LKSSSAAPTRDLAAFDINDPELLIRVGYRPAAVQWSRQPVAPGRLAIGDAALALSPLAGQGLRFAVSSALAAAMLRSWSNGPAPLASDYYRRFVDGVRSRHLAKLAVITAAQPGSVASQNLNRAPPDSGHRLRWACRVERIGVNRGGWIVAD
jgi:2-polyprenyl-6-methoxyphenol hydroxylase-like FAD-dependent oxidoreductase